jgi:hypothetical protein
MTDALSLAARAELSRRWIPNRLSPTRERRGVARCALRERVLAPPDAGFSARLAGLAAAARQRAEACDAAYHDGFEWPAARGGAEPPYELQPGTGRRGREELWARFDEAVAERRRQRLPQSRWA